MFSAIILSLTISVCLSAPTANEDMLRSLINPPKDASKGIKSFTTGTSTSTTNNNMIGQLVSALEKQPITSVKTLEEALTASIKSQLVTSFANLSPEQITTITGAANPTELSQLNLTDGINRLVRLIVRQILQSLIPILLGRIQTATTNVGFPMGGSVTPQQPLGGMFGSFGSMLPMGMMLPGIFKFMDNIL